METPSIRELIAAQHKKMQLFKRKLLRHDGGAAIEGNNVAMLVEKHKRGNALYLELRFQSILFALLATWQRFLRHLFGVGIRFTLQTIRAPELTNTISNG